MAGKEIPPRGTIIRVGALVIGYNPPSMHREVITADSIVLYMGYHERNSSWKDISIHYYQYLTSSGRVIESPDFPPVWEHV